VTSNLRYPYVVFDLDGTLVDSYAALTDAINYTLDAAGTEALSEGELRRYVGEGVQKLLERAFRGAPVPPDAQSNFEARYDAVCGEQSTLLAGVEATLAALHESGVAMSVCTNKPTSFSAKILEHLGVARFFAAVVGPDLAGARKPDARHLMFAIDSMKGSAAKALLVGDMPIDVAAARNAGIDVAVIATGSSSIEELRAARPDFFLGAFAEILSVVRAGRAVNA
jgi:phosphoglycolate phosphatase